ncbi:MAG: tetratricopeptide repeat protein [Vicinamibacterales bacterium]
MNADLERMVMVAGVLALLGTMSAGAQSQAGRPDGCASGEPAARVAACTQQLGQRTLDQQARVRALVNRATAQEELDQQDLALKDLQSALDLDSTSALVLRTRAVVLHRTGRSSDALTDLTRAITAHPDDLSLFKVRGNIYAETGQAGRAVEDFSKVLDTAPGDLQARQARALVLAAAGAHQRAVSDFNRILGREPRARGVRAARAFSLFRMQQYRLAIQDWDVLLKDDPNQFPVIYCRGVARVLSGDAAGQADVDAIRQQHPEVATAAARACPAGS